MNKRLYGLMNWPKIEEIIYSECDDPHALLGPHDAGSQTLVQAFFPAAKKVAIVLNDTGETFQMELADTDGYFAAFLPMPEREVPGYHYVVKEADGTVSRHGAAYRFAPLISKKDTELFKNGIHYTVYEKLGAHPMAMDGVGGTYFAVWVPHALRVSVVGDFNRWDGRVHQMRRLWDSGIFEIFVPGAEIGQNYKFEIKLKNGLTYLKADPYCNAAQLRPDTASVITDLYEFYWEDAEFLSRRAKLQLGNVPISVYEFYPGSFTAPEEGQLYADFRSIADKLIPFVREMGYTHVQLMPVMEHPLDESWGYQTLGYYAPTARYGTPQDFMYFVNELHKAGIGVILDWMPASFPRDVHGLDHFDGTCLYEEDCADEQMRGQGMSDFCFGRHEVSNYLLANALFWVEKYHVDGICVGAVEELLYGSRRKNIYGESEDLEALEFLKHLNSILKKRNHGVITIASGGHTFPEVTGALDAGGLGFDLQWNAGCAESYLDYIHRDPYFRSHHHSELTFSTVYAYSENFMVGFSHEELTHGKGSLLEQMAGDKQQKFANLRLTYGYLMTHPGKKLLFMGQDVAEADEWNERRPVEWNLMAFEENEGISRLICDLNRIYREQPELYAVDDAPEKFEWINSIAADTCCLSYARKGLKEDEMLLVVANFSGVAREVATGVPAAGKYKEILNTDDVKYGGSGVVNSRAKRSRAVECDERDNSLVVRLAPLSLSILKFFPVALEEDTAKQAGGRTRKRG